MTKKETIIMYGIVLAGYCLMVYGFLNAISKM